MGRQRGPGRPVLENLKGGVSSFLAVGEATRTHRFRASDEVQEWLGAMTAEERGRLVTEISPFRKVAPVAQGSPLQVLLAEKYPTSRPSFDQMGMETARLWARRSADDKFKVGVAILSETSHTLVSIGYNGRYPGSETENRASRETGGSQFAHGEINALLRARWEPGEKHTLYSVLEPCHDCALAILAARHINRVVYAQPYAGDGKRRRGSEILREAGVEVIEWQS